MEEREALGGLEAVVERVAVQLHAFRVELLLDEDRVDGLENGPAVGLEGERAAQKHQRFVGLAERREELAGAAREPRARRVVARERLELGRVDLGEALLGARDARQPLELLDGVLVREILVEQLGGRLERRAVVLLLLLVELGETREHVAAPVGIDGDVEARLERCHHARPVGAREVHRLEQLRGARAMLRLLRLGEQALELGDGTLVAAFLAERLLELLERALGIVQAPNGDRGDLHAQIAGVAGLLRRSAARRATTRSEWRSTAVYSVSSAASASSSRPRSRIDSYTSMARAFVLRFGEQARAAVEQATAVVVGARDLGAALEHAEQVRDVARFLVERLEGGERARLVGTKLERLVVVLSGELAIAELVLRDVGDLQRDGELHVAVEDARSDLAQELHVVRLATGRGGEPVDLGQPLREIGVSERRLSARSA